MSGADVKDRFFLDTNVLVYAFDHSAPDKRRLADGLIRDALLSGRGAISSQVVQEFLSIATRRFRSPMPVAACREYLSLVLLPLCRHYPSAETYSQALSIVEETGYSFYDSLIVAAALESGCRTLLTEDLQHGRVVRGLTIVNPFSA